MERAQPDLFTVQTDAQWTAINSPVRVEMLVFMIMSGPCAIRELAELMDRPADGLYHHLRLLVAAGLVEETGTRRTGTQTEAIYQTVAKDVTIDRNLQRKKTRDRTLRLFRTIMQHAQRAAISAVETGAAVVEGERQNFRLDWLTSWLDDRQLDEVKQHQDAIRKILRDGMRQRKGQLVALLTYLAPVVRTRGARSALNSDD